MIELSEEEILERLQEEKELKEKRRSRFFKRHRSFNEEDGIFFHYTDNELFNNSEKRFQEIQKELQYFIDYFSDPRDEDERDEREEQKYHTLEEVMTIFPEKIKEEIDSKEYYESYRYPIEEETCILTYNESICILNYAYSLVLKKRENSRKNLTQLLVERFIGRDLSSIIANYCIYI